MCETVSPGDIADRAYDSMPLQDIDLEAVQRVIDEVLDEVAPEEKGDLAVERIESSGDVILVHYRDEWWRCVTDFVHDPSMMSAIVRTMYGHRQGLTPAPTRSTITVQ